jgi:16S rRNA (cytosine1402-N4)-methyltransferase
MSITDKKIQKHIPVMASEVLEYLIPEEGACRVIDCTLGYGGHSSLILQKNKDVELLGIDRDDNALNYAENALEFASDRIQLVKGQFSEIEDIMDDVGWNNADAVLLDIGVSSPQIDEAERGFSHRFNGPLDMRMDRKSAKTAARILNHVSLEELAHIFRDFGEVRKPWKLAEAIVERRKIKPWFGTKELAELCEKVLPRPRKGGLPVPTLCFQALRIAVNDELLELEESLEAVLDILSPGGRVAVISYHSLEDRIVKNIFKREATQCLCPPGLPVCICGHVSTLKVLTKKPLTATNTEIQINRRSASAKMRVAEKL